MSFLNFLPQYVYKGQENIGLNLDNKLRTTHHKEWRKSEVYCSDYYYMLQNFALLI